MLSGVVGLEVMNSKQTGPPYEYEADVCGALLIPVPITSKLFKLKTIKYNK